MEFQLPSLDIKTDMDPSMETAFKEAEENKNLTPLIKQELKYTILNRRHQSGKGDLDLDEKKPMVKKELTHEEKQKKLRRKEQNRRAAQRCREKKKRISEQVFVDYLNEQEEKAKLQNEIETLKRDKQNLERILREHALTCPRAVTPTPLTPPFDEQPSFLFDVPTTVPFSRDSVTPYQPDPFEEIEPSMFLPDFDQLQQKEPTCALPTCQQTYTEMLPDLELPDENATGYIFLHPGSPEMQHGGRRSISEYADCDLTANL